MVFIFLGENSTVKFVLKLDMYHHKIAFKKLRKMHVILPKSSFCSQDIQVFILSSLSEFFPLLTFAELIGEGD